MKQIISLPFFQSFECTNPACGLRFPSDLSTTQFDRCPRCGSVMKPAGEPYSNFQRPPSGSLSTGFTFDLVLDNLRSAQNVGSIFRTADGAGVRSIYCCGTTPTPEHRGVKKASLGAEEHTPWHYHPNCPALVDALKASGYLVFVLESTTDSKSIIEIDPDNFQSTNLVLVLGNEISGVDPVVQEKADALYHIPMTGTKTSLNVAVAAGISIYWLIGCLPHLPE